MKEEDLTPELLEKCRKLAKWYGRAAKKVQAEEKPKKEDVYYLRNKQ